MTKLPVHKWSYTLNGNDNYNDKIYTFIGPEIVLNHLAPDIKEILKKEDPGTYNRKMKMYQQSIDEYKDLGYLAKIEH